MELDHFVYWAVACMVTVVFACVTVSGITLLVSAWAHTQAALKVEMSIALLKSKLENSTEETLAQLKALNARPIPAPAPMPVDPNPAVKSKPVPVQPPRPLKPASSKVLVCKCGQPLGSPLRAKISDEGGALVFKCPACGEVEVPMPKG